MSVTVTVLRCLVVSLFAASAFAATVADLRLVDAVKAKNFEAVQSLVTQHVDVNAASGDGATALAWAAHWNELEVAGLLIKAGANVNAGNDYGVTPLWLACDNGNDALVQILLSAGANANAPLTGSSETPLMRCARTGNLHAVELLLAKTANVNAKESRRGQTALMWAVAEKHADVAKSLIAHGADVHARTKHVVLQGSSGYHYNAGYEGDFGTRAKGGLTPLMFAAEHGDVECGRVLLAAGASVNEATPEGTTALVIAAANAQEEFGKFLLDNGAKPDAADDNGITALHWSLLRGIMVLRSLNPFSYMYFMYRPNMPGLVDALLKHGANPNVRLTKGPEYPFSAYGINPMGATPFMLAAATYDVPIMRALAAVGADPNLPTTEDQMTPVMIATALGERPPADRIIKGFEQRALDSVKAAVEAGADVNVKNKVGQSALHLAAARGKDSIIQYLVEKGARIDSTDNKKRTPLSMALGAAPIQDRFEKDKIPVRKTVDLLLKLGATPVTGPIGKSSEADE